MLNTVSLMTQANVKISESFNILGLSPTSYYQWIGNPFDGPFGVDRRTLNTKENRPNRYHPEWQLTEEEEDRIYALVNSPEYADYTFHGVYKELKHSGVKLCSESTFGRAYKRAAMRRGSPLAKPKSKRKPRSRPQEFVANMPGKVLAWDITEIKAQGDKKFHVYAVMCVYSRHILHARVFETPTAENAVLFFKETFTKYGLKKGAPEGTFVVHSDNGKQMTADATISFINSYGGKVSFSRPRVSDDNPYIESVFNTLKNHFGLTKYKYKDVQQAQMWLDKIVDKYNNTPHGRLNNVMPIERFKGEEEQAISIMRKAEEDYYRQHPERFSSGRVKFTSSAGPVYLNPSIETQEQLGIHRARKPKYPPKAPSKRLLQAERAKAAQLAKEAQLVESATLKLTEAS